MPIREGFRLAGNASLKAAVILPGILDLYCLTISLAVKPDCITLTGSFA